MPDIEPETVGIYDDTQLEAIDQLMVEAHDRGRSLPHGLSPADLTEHVD